MKDATLYDKVKNFKNINMQTVRGNNFYLKSASVFNIAERSIDFEKKTRILQKDTPIILASKMPFDNTVFSFDDMLEWIVQVGDDMKIESYNGDVVDVSIIYSILSVRQDEVTILRNLSKRTFLETSIPYFLISKQPPFTVHNMGYVSLSTGYVKLEDVEHVSKTMDLPTGAVRSDPAMIMGSIVTALKRIMHFTDFLSCKNIVQEKQVHSKSIIKKNKKLGKKALSSFYTLKIKPTSSSQNYESKDLWSNRVHLCRGHIKTYTDEKPLFGKIVGNIWCPPHARGNKNKGVIVKDYEVRA